MEMHEDTEGRTFSLADRALAGIDIAMCSINLGHNYRAPCGRRRWSAPCSEWTVHDAVRPFVAPRV